MDANTQMAVAALVLTAGVVAFGYTVKSMTSLSHRKMAVTERRLDDLNVYVRHVGDDLRSLKSGVSAKIDAEEARARIAEAAQFLGTGERERAKAVV